eukprot:gene5602-4565_t
MVSKYVALLACVVPLVSSTCTTVQNIAYVGSSIPGHPITKVGSPGECCDNCISTGGLCQFWNVDKNNMCSMLEFAASSVAAAGGWAGWAGTGPTPPAPPAPGVWSSVYAHAGCQGTADQGDVELQDLGRKYTVEGCKKACEQTPGCGFIDHADNTDGACVLYATCATAAPCDGTGWFTYQLGRNDSAPYVGCSGSPPGPAPPPAPTPSDPSGFDCQVRLLAMEFASEILGANANTSVVAASLNLDVDTWCKPTAQVASRAAGSGTAVMVRGGTYFVGETLRFGAADSGNTWSSYGNEDVVLSGGIDLSGLKWSKSATNPQALEATLPAHYAAAAGAAAGAAAATIKTLFVDGVREVRAKYPNGDPLNPGSAGGYAANAAGAAGGQYSSNGDQFPDTVTVKSAGGVVLSQGSSVGNVPMTFTVAEPESNFNPTRNNFFAYQNHSAERFNNTFNHPFWNSQVSPGFKVGDSFAKGSKNWATPSTGVVHMYHSGGWGGWQFQVAERPDPDTIIFGCTRLSDGTQVACPERNVPGPDEVCTFDAVGDSAIAMVGSSQLMVGTKGKGLMPTNNLIEKNIVDTVGVYGKQTSAYFKAKSDSNLQQQQQQQQQQQLQLYIFVLQMLAVVFNSWDRQPIVHDDDEGNLAINPKVHHLRHNFIMNTNWLGTTKSGYSVDYDDGSSQYNATANFLVYGAFKVRDGINRVHEKNVIYGKPADYQCDGFNSTVFAGNTVISGFPKAGRQVEGGRGSGQGISFGCVGEPFGPLGTYNSVQQNGNTYFTPADPTMPFSACGRSFAELQAAGYEKGSTISSTLAVADAIAMAKKAVW